MFQGLLANYTKQSRNAKDYAKLAEPYTDITEVTAELLHTPVDKIVEHGKKIELCALDEILGQGDHHDT